MIALLIISSVVIITVMVVVFTVVVGACMVSTIDGVAMTTFLCSFVQVNAASSMCWVGESSVRIFAEKRFSSGSRFRAHRGSKSGPKLTQLNSSAPSTLAAPLVGKRGI